MSLLEVVSNLLFKDRRSEWPERLGPLLPARRLEIALAPGKSPTARRAVIDPGAGWEARLACLSAEI